MPIRSARFPLLNPLRFTPANDGLPAKYNTWPADRGFFRDQIKAYQPKNGYVQKFTNLDRITVYFDSLAPEARISLLDDKGVELFYFDLTPAIALAGNTVNIGGTDYVYNTFSLQLKIEDMYVFGSTFQKHLYFVVEEIYGVTGDDDSVYHVSEPMLVRNGSWKGTMLIEATQTVNEFDVLFEQVTPTFNYRIECDVTDDPAPGFDDTVFEDQQAQVRNLQSIPYRLWYLVLKGVPKYMIDKVNRAISLKQFAIDGTRYSKDVSAKFSIDSSDSDPLKSAQVQLREYDLSRLGEYKPLAFLELVTIPGSLGGPYTFPFAINRLAVLGINSAVISFPTIIEDATELDDFIDYLNGDFKTSKGLGGTFSINASNVLGYMPVTGEDDLVAGADSYAWSSYLAFEMTNTGFGGNYDFQFQGDNYGSIGRIIVDFGDGLVRNYSALGVLETVSHFWGGGAGAKHTLRIFHAGSGSTSMNSVGKLFFYSTTSALVTEIKALAHTVAPDLLNTFIMNDQDLSGGVVDASFLEVAKGTLSWVSFQNSGITGINIFSTSGWSAITTFLINLNQLTTGANGVNLIASRIAANWLLGLTGGTIMMMQSPAASVTSTSGLTRFGALTGVFGWTVSYDP